MISERPPELQGRLHFLDALRGVAAVSVMLFHFYANGVSPIHESLASTLPQTIDCLVSHLWLGVEVFFVLSGFVIAASMEGAITNLGFAGRFILRRSLRLDPAYWTAMAIMLAYFMILWPTKWHGFYLEFGGFKGLLANMFYIQNLSWIYPAKSVLEVSWTLCLEVQFYLSFLCIVVGCTYLSRLLSNEAGRDKFRLVAIATGIGLLFSWSLYSDIRDPSNGFTGRSWTFFLGVITYSLLRYSAPTWLAAAFLAPLTLYLVFWEANARWTATVATASAIYLVGRMGILHSLLAWKWLLYLGKISYSIYLIHNVVGMAILHLLKPFGDGSVIAAWCSFALAVGCTLVASVWLHRYVEAPSNRLSARLKGSTGQMATEPSDADWKTYATSGVSNRSSTPPLPGTPNPG